MSNPCDVVAERVVLGEPLGDVADHAAECAKCRRLAALPTELGALKRGSDVDPGIGFAARMTAGAQHRMVVRQRRRIATAAVAAIAATSLLTFAITRDPEPATQPQPAADLGSQQPDEAAADDADDARALVRLADTDRSSRFSANWRDIQKPLKPYRALVQGVQP